jgi:hypothetical protein
MWLESYRLSLFELHCLLGWYGTERQQAMKAELKRREAHK